jgi:hypothetical protein
LGGTPASGFMPLLVGADGGVGWWVEGFVIIITGNAT